MTTIEVKISTNDDRFSRKMKRKSRTIDTCGHRHFTTTAHDTTVIRLVLGSDYFSEPSTQEPVHYLYVPTRIMAKA